MPKTIRKSSSADEAAPVLRVDSALPFESLDKSSYIPMYVQIQSQLLDMIHSSRLATGDPLPSEEELSRVYGVSRMTSRQALQLLKSQGFASRYKGRGTFVTLPKVEKDISHLAGFTAEMQALGMKASSELLASETIAATDEVAKHLAIENGSPTFRLRRLRLADGLPVAIEESYLSKAKFAGIEKLHFASRSLYETLRERYGVRFGMADEILEARAASRQEAELLKIAPRSSLLVISRTLWNVDGEPVEMARSSYRGDRYRAVLRIPAKTVA